MARFKVGGGRACRVSLVQECAASTRAGRWSWPRVRTRATPTSRITVTDNRHVTTATGWSPRRGLDVLMDDVFSWLREHRGLAEPVVTSYLFIVFYCYLEKYLTREDYRKRLDVPDRRLQVSSR